VPFNPIFHKKISPEKVDDAIAPFVSCLIDDIADV